MTNHEEIQMNIPDHVRGRLGREVAAAIEAHLTECAECAEVHESVRLIASAIAREGEDLFGPHPATEDLRAFSSGGEARAPEALARHVATCASCGVMVTMWRQRGSRSASRASRPMLAAVALLAAGVVMGAGLGILLSAAGARGGVFPGRSTSPSQSLPPAAAATPFPGTAAGASSLSGGAEPRASERGRDDGARDAHRALDPPPGGPDSPTAHPSDPLEVSVRGSLPARSIPLVHLRALRGVQPPQTFELRPDFEAVYVMAALVLPPEVAGETPVVFDVRGSGGARIWSSAPEAASILRAQIDDAGMVGHLIPGEVLGPGDYLLSATAGEGPAQREIARIAFEIRARADSPPPG